MNVNWTVQRLAVLMQGANSQGITSWGVYVDGGVSRIVQPHIHACLELMDLTAESVIAGKASPFHTLVHRPSSDTRQVMKAFEELLGEQTIEGRYCDDRGRAMIMRWSTLTQISSVQPRSGSYDVAIRSDHMMGLGHLYEAIASCVAIDRPADRRVATLTVRASSLSDLATELRLLGNLGSIRWDRADTTTLELLGEPLP